MVRPCSLLVLLAFFAGMMMTDGVPSGARSSSERDDTDDSKKIPTDNISKLQMSGCATNACDDAAGCNPPVNNVNVGPSVGRPSQPGSANNVNVDPSIGGFPGGANK
ncbi:hypothetical protein BCR42DRAFT_397862 [Absidia repens]|uniref:Uncharacterized protein n=1 Tax=Absidia repens TaxID=90262 RepID=A0A1X2HZS5_9FUNG|nr:hypothetical protein BCR42DRAFT_397862 [Absidia repens]